MKEISEKEMKQQFRVFLERLSIMTENIKKPELTKTDSKELIKKFFDPSNKLFKNIEMIMECMAVSAVKHSCESVLESYVSMYENHFDSRRNTEEDGTNEEFTIATNVPNLANSDSVIKEAMDDYWKERGGEWHFFRKSVLEKLKSYKGNSEVLNRLLSTPSKLPFMS